MELLRKGTKHVLNKQLKNKHLQKKTVKKPRKKTGYFPCFYGGVKYVCFTYKYAIGAK